MSDNLAVKELKHSLATPITSILCILDLIDELGQVDITKLTNLAVIREAAEELRLLVGGREASETDKRVFCLKKELKKIVKTFQKDYKVEFTLSLPDKGTELYGKKEVFLTIIHSLLNNAAEAYDDCQVGRKINLSLVPLSNRIIIFINDNGRGMSQLKSLFLGIRYWSNKSYKSGLGLTIAKAKLKKEFSAKLSFHTQRGVGTTVMVELPVRVG
jgi:signal transduction histidine kinase